MKHRPLLLVITAPSGTGKTTVIRNLLKRDPQLAYSVSATTRKRRKGEVSGRSYIFMSRKEFEQKIQEGYFLEWAQVYGEYYGTPLPPIQKHLENGKDVVLDLDIQGKRALEQKFGSQVVSVFLLPPSLEELRRRLEMRGTDSPEQLQLRFEMARRELQWALECDYVVLNDQQELAVERVWTVLKAERMRRFRVIHPLLENLQGAS